MPVWKCDSEAPCPRVGFTGIGKSLDLLKRSKRTLRGRRLWSTLSVATRKLPVIVFTDQSRMANTTWFAWVGAMPAPRGLKRPFMTCPRWKRMSKQSAIYIYLICVEILKVTSSLPSMVSMWLKIQVCRVWFWSSSTRVARRTFQKNPQLYVSKYLRKHRCVFSALITTTSSQHRICVDAALCKLLLATWRG